MFARRLIALAAAGFLLLPGPAAAQQEDEGGRRAQALQQAVEAMQKVLQPGPSMLKLGTRATLKLPQGAGFVRQPEAGAWAAASGYPADPRLDGMIVPTSEQNWVVFIDYRAGIRLDDADAADWNADDLLSRLNASTQAGNAARKQRGEPELEVRSWLVEPRYDAQEHRLIWAALSPEKGGEADEGTANIHAYALGNAGYYEFTLVAPAAEASSYVPIARSLLAGLQFEPGNRYRDPAGGQAEQRSITSLITTVPPGPLATLVAYLEANWIWLVAGLMVAVVLGGAALRALRRHSV